MAQRTISGKVTDDSGEGLPGVNVVIKGTTTGVTTDLDGNYQISVEDGTTLTFSYVGFETQEVAVGSRTAIDVTLGGATELQEVVVTAAAIEREKRSIGYGISQVDGKDLTVARETNIVNALQGKTTGVIVNNTSGNPGGSSQVIIRGITSLAGNNNPLWIVDGIPIFNSQTVTGSRISGNRDTFNGAAVINPDDVESMSILKGAAATALYGSRAAAGAIIVTTKKGKKNNGGPQISINSTFRVDELFREPDMQYEFAGGVLAKYDSSVVVNAFGSRINGQLVNNHLGDQVALKAHEENYKDFYETGKTFINNIAIADADERGDYRLSVTSLNQDGVLPGASLDRLTVSMNAGVKHNDWLNTRFGIQYISSDVEGTGAQGANDLNVLGWTTFTPTTDFNLFKPWVDGCGNQINNIVGSNNPFWTRFENINRREDDRMIASLTQVVTPIENVNITSRIGYDYNIDRRLLTNKVGTITALTGTYTVDNFVREQFNWDVIADYSTNFGDVSLTTLAGYNFNSRETRQETLDASDLAIPELFSPSA
ncbi:MAG: SusC/RagA family TonB-linked outer membrane protein [Ekhidna sp.]